MKIKNLEISNFKAIKYIHLKDLEDTVVIAGPNGCGKSCIFDAIRLIVSFYGATTVKDWLNEFQLDPRTLHEDIKKILNDTSKELRISVDFTLDESEKEFLANNYRHLIETQIWNNLLPRDNRATRGGRPSLASELELYRPDVEERRDEKSAEFEKEFQTDLFRAELTIAPNGREYHKPSSVLSVIFDINDPKNIGFVDYHGADRSYKREKVGGVNLNIESSEQRLKKHALYNYTNKYNNIKAEMAGAYIRELIAKEAEIQLNQNENIIQTLQELFRIFFPGKTFLGPQPSPDGNLTFPVMLEDGSQHDIDELSSGEKEVLYGYLRLQNTSPKNSILLLDEPELHLNPRLILGLPKFYQKYIGINNNNQIWLTTHSDAMLRETVGETGFSVFHMRSSINLNDDSQIEEIRAGGELKSLFLDLVGDLSIYSPSSKVVIFEGGGETEFDVTMVKTLFPEIVDKATLISSENKVKVRALHQLLDRATQAQDLPFEFFSVVDKDSDNTAISSNSRALTWDVYHIENYLLDVDYITKVINDGELEQNKVDVDTVCEWLEECARETLNGLLNHNMAKHINTPLINCLNPKINPDSSDLSSDYFHALEKSSEKITKIIEETLSLDALKELEESLRRELEEQLESRVWTKTFRGRNILKRLVSKLRGGIDYIQFRNRIMSKMREDGFKPEGMAEVINAVIDA